jgi:site-specific DNA-cytosine methylase
MVDGIRDDKNGTVERRYEGNDNGKTNALTTVQKDNYLLEDMMIRKLTPLECERLQTVPEGYTKGVSNTQRYKMLGNGFTVDVVAGVLR